MWNDLRNTSVRMLLVLLNAHRNPKNQSRMSTQHGTLKKQDGELPTHDKKTMFLFFSCNWLKTSEEVLCELTLKAVNKIGFIYTCQTILKREGPKVIILEFLFYINRTLLSWHWFLSAFMLTLRESNKQ